MPMPTLAHLTTILREAGEHYHILPLQGAAVALITQRGGRILGLFPTFDAKNLLWTNSAAFDTVAGFKQFVAQGNWNLGGERIWIAPEIQYNVRDRNDFWGTLVVPPQMDPGEYALQTASNTADYLGWNATMRLHAYNLASGEQILSVANTLKSAANPLRHLNDSLSDIAYFGYEHHVILAGTQANTVSEAWNLVQLNAGGQLLIPCLPVVQASDYFGDVPDEARQLHFGDVPHLRLNITGKRQYKIGYQAFSMTGRMAYHHALPDGREVVLIRSFFNNPSNRYAEEPPDKPGVNGHSVHVYNDGGEFGGNNAFGEMECTGRTLQGGTDLDDVAHDVFTLWAYLGTPPAIQRVIHLLLGVRL